MLRRILIFAAVLMLIAVVGTATAFELTTKETLGRTIFFDTNLSEPEGQACAGCHGTEVGWSGQNPEGFKHAGVYHGAIKSRFGNRKPPTISYSTFSPKFHLENATTGLFAGGSFFDGSATGERFGSPAVDQATKPFLNPLEMNNPDEATIVEKVCHSNYADIFKQVWGNNSCDNEDEAIKYISLSIVAFEGSEEVSPFSSKFDAYLDGKVVLTEEERKGLELFRGKGLCDQCHVSTIGPDGKHPLFTNFIYGNPGTPRNPDNPFYNQTDFNPLGAAYIDPGLGGFLETRPEFIKYQTMNYGKFKVPTLRNVGKRPNSSFIKVYMHNGFLKSLKDVVHFYNTRDILGDCALKANPQSGVNCWPLPEMPQTKNPAVGNLGLSDSEEHAIVAFLETLSDGFVPGKEVPVLTPVSMAALVGLLGLLGIFALRRRL